MLGRPDTWNIALSHAQVADSVAPALLMETTWAIFALFLRERAGIGPHVLNAMWMGTNRSYNAAMTLLMYCAMEKCVPGCENEIKVTEYRGPELLLESPKGVQIRAMQELFGRQHEDMFKEGMMYFMTYNQLNEYAEGLWSNDVLERAFFGGNMWTAFSGEKQVSRARAFGCCRGHGLDRLESLDTAILFHVWYDSVFGGRRMCVPTDGEYADTGGSSGMAA